MKNFIRQFHIHLWREWREHRVTLVALALCGLLAACVLGASVPARALQGAAFVSFAMVIGALLVSLCVGADMLSGERQRGTAAFLARLPSGLAMSFRAKLLLFLLASILGAVFGGLLMLALMQIKSGVLPFGWEHDASEVMIAAPCIGLWVFAVSSWVRSGALTIPTTALFLGLVFLPVILVTGMLSGLPGISSPTWILPSYLSLEAPWIVGPLVCAWIGFVYGGRRGRRRSRATMLSVMVACLCFAPSWAWAGSKYLAAKAASVRIQNVMVGEGGRFAFVTLSEGVQWLGLGKSRTLSSALLLDLESGAIERAGEAGASQWYPAKQALIAYNRFQSHGWPVVQLVGNMDRAPYIGEAISFDGALGLPMDPNDAEQRLLGSLADWKPFQTFMKPGALPTIGEAGAGYRVCLPLEAGGYETLFWDPVSGRRATEDSLMIGDKPWSVSEVEVRPGRWLVSDRRGALRLVDPETGEFESFTSILYGAQYCGMFDDGSLLVLRAGELERMDPKSGQASPIVETGGEPDAGFLIDLWGNRKALSATHPSLIRGTCRAGAGERSGRTAFAILDPRKGSLSRLELSPLSRSYPHILFQGERNAWVEFNGRRLLRIDLISGEFTEVLNLDKVQLGSIL